MNHLATQLNAYLKRTNNLTEDIVVVSSLVESDGSAAPHTNNKLILLLTNIEKDTMPQSGARGTGFEGRTLINSRPVYLNLYVILAANFGGSNYAEALKFISKAIAFFQMQPVFDKHSSPDLDSRIDRLVLDIENLNIQDLSNLWGLLGGKYLPSVYYRVRMVAINPDSVVAQLPLVSKPQGDLRG